MLVVYDGDIDAFHRIRREISKVCGLKEKIRPIFLHEDFEEDYEEEIFQEEKPILSINDFSNLINAVKSA